MRLIDCFVKPLAYSSYIIGISGENPVTMTQITDGIHRLMEESDKMADLAGFSREEFDDARFAVCAWMDEAILCSDWPEREEWMGVLLQRKYYSTTRAGEEFFQRMGNLNDANREVRDVYYHCLALGFKGRYFAPDAENELERIKRLEYSRLKGENSMLMNSAFMGFFPDSYPTNPMPRKRRFIKIALSYTTMFMIIAPLVFLILTYLSYSRMLDGMAENIIRLELK